MRKQFSLFFPSVNAFEKPTFDDEKNCKNRGFHVFYQFSVTQKPLPGYLILGAKTNIWASRCRIQMLEKLKILQKSFFQLRVESCYKKQFFHVILQVFFNFWIRQVLALLHSRRGTPANFFPYLETRFRAIAVSSAPF